MVMALTNVDSSSSKSSCGGELDWGSISDSGTIDPLPPTNDLEVDDNDGSDNNWETVAEPEDKED